MVDYRWTAGLDVYMLSSEVNFKYPVTRSGLKSDIVHVGSASIDQGGDICGLR